MDSFQEFEIRIVEYRNIIRVIKDVYDFDFSDFALTSLKRRFEKVIIEHNLKHSDNLVSRILEDSIFFDKFLQEIAVEGTEMFRDPSLWRYLRDDLFPLLFKENLKVKIWFPCCVSGDELFTLAIVLRELDLEKQVEIIATCYNQLLVDKIKSGILKQNKLEVSKDNYLRYQGKFELTNYYKVIGDQILRDTSLIKNVNFLKQNINFDNSPRDINLVMFRNKMIYYNQNLQDKVLKIVHDSMILGGYLAIGFKEQLGIKNCSSFKIVNVTENISKKI